MGILAAKKVAVIFPGQGSQFVGMGLDLANKYRVAADVFAAADQILGMPLSGVCFEGPEEELTRTINTQPALFVAGVAAYEVARQKGLKADCAAGHSVGEYAALYAAGAFEFEDGLRLVHKRAELMDRAAQAAGGTMAAVLGLDPEKVRQAAEAVSGAGVVVAANYNSPAQTVISGEPEAVERAGVIAKEMGAKRVVALKVSGAFHSPLMQAAADGMKEVLQRAPINDAKIPVAANFTGDLEQKAEEIRENLARQMVGSVRWIDCVEKMTAAGVDTFVELGAGNVLGGLVRKIAPQASVYSADNGASIDALFE